jgi:hypothetical protein
LIGDAHTVMKLHAGWSTHFFTKPYARSPCMSLTGGDPAAAAVPYELWIDQS